MSGYLTPIKGKAYCGCGCGYREDHALMSSHPHPGFGGFSIMRDGEHVYPWGEDIYSDELEDKTWQEIEDVAAGDPDHDWRVQIDGPLADYTYQRQGEGKWALVAQGKGFA